MDPESDYMLTHTFALIILAVALILSYFRWSYRYWFNRKMPFLEPKIPFGNTENPARRKNAFAQRMVRYYQSFKQRGHKHGGIFVLTKPVYIPVDPEYIKNVLSRGYSHFADRGGYYNEKSDPLSAHLFTIGGQKWKNLRSKLTPTFSSGKMKMMFPILVECGEPMIQFIEKLSDEKKAVDIKTVLSSFTMDVIGSCAFGIDCNSFTNPSSEFTTYARKIFNPSKLQALKSFFVLSCKRLAELLDLVLTPKDVSIFFLKVVKETVEYREQNNVTRNDFMQLLLDLKNNDSTGLGKLSIEEVSAQAFMFFLAGYETSSTTLTFCLHELAHNPDIQERVRQETLEVMERNNGKLTYEGVMEMKYMNQVIEETLRKYPPAVMLIRTCNLDYPIPETDIIVEKGTMVFVPVYAVHHDPDIYPNPDVFDPDRFNEENKSKRHPCSYLPFGEGPRICIGVRFGMMETKVCLALILQNFRLTPQDTSNSKIDFAINSFVLAPKETIYLNFEKLNSYS